MNNLVPLPYRRVSVQPYAGEMSEAAIRAHLLGREAYRRTDYVALEGDDAWAVVAIDRTNDVDLFSEILDVRVLALPERCVFVHEPATDCANPSALAEAARRHGVGPDGTLLVQGLYDHVNFIHHPDPIRLRVVEVSPPDPPKLYDLVKHVLSYADLPPIVVDLDCIELTELAAEQPADAYLVPCRSGGLDKLNAPVFFLDERPAERRNWVLVGCERSLQFHRHYYGDEPPRVEMCPRKLAKPALGPTMLKCCLLEFDIERDGETMVVPWGTDLAMVERALHELVEGVARAAK